MTWRARIGLWLAAASIIVPVVSAEEPPAESKAKVEFRWLENHPIKNLTNEKGIKTTCGEELSYLHKKAVLTNQDVAAARLSRHDLTANGLGVLFSVELRLTDEAKQKLKSDVDERGGRMLAVLVDGKYWGASNFAEKSLIDKYNPSVGFMSSESDAERIVASFK